LQDDEELKEAEQKALNGFKNKKKNGVFVNAEIEEETGERMDSLMKGAWVSLMFEKLLKPQTVRLQSPTWMKKLH